MANKERSEISEADPITTVELMFKAVDADLDGIASQLDREFCRDIRREDQLSTRDDPIVAKQSLVNPVDLLRRIQQIRTEFALIVQNISVIREAEKDALEFMRTHVIASCAGLALLQAVAGVPFPPEKPEVLKRFEALLVTVNYPTIGDTAGDLVQGGSSVDAGSASSSPGDDEKEQTREDVRPPLRVAASKGANHFIPVHQYQFDTVSSLVRGRLKLEDVNITYTKLWQYFKEGKNRKPLTAVDMDRMGFRVSGKTGFSKLKVLQILKFIQLSCKGEVLKLLF